MNIDEKMEQYLNESSSWNFLTAVMNSVNAAIKIIDVALEEDSGAKELEHLKAARGKLVEARSELRKIPLESVKSMASAAYNRVKGFVKNLIGLE